MVQTTAQGNNEKTYAVKIFYDVIKAAIKSGIHLTSAVTNE